jgi:hypothetical protein
MRLVQTAEAEQCPAKRHASGNESGVLRKPRPTGLDSFSQLAGSPLFFGELGEGDRRGVALDSAPQFFDTGLIRHSSPRTLIVRELV